MRLLFFISLIFSLCCFVSGKKLSLKREYVTSIQNLFPYREVPIIGRNPRISGRYASELLNGTPVYITLAVCSFRFNILHETIESLLKGNYLPDQIFVVLSEKSFLLDEGISLDDINSSPVMQIAKSTGLVTFVHTDNFGPHRKLLPVLARKIEEDCIIVTVDDDTPYPPIFLEGLVSTYVRTGKNACIANRARSFGLLYPLPNHAVDIDWRFVKYFSNNYTDETLFCPISPRRMSLRVSKSVKEAVWPLSLPGSREMLTLPTGVGGVLYAPYMFNLDVVFNKRLVEITQTGDDILFRLGVMANNIPVVIGCDPSRYYGVKGAIICPKLPSEGIKTRRLRGVENRSYPHIVFNHSTLDSTRRLSPVADESKKLWTGPNADINNNIMLEEAMRYLENMGVDIQQVIKNHIKERNVCLKGLSNMLIGLTYDIPEISKPKYRTVDSKKNSLIGFDATIADDRASIFKNLVECRLHLINGLQTSASCDALHLPRDAIPFVKRTEKGVVPIKSAEWRLALKLWNVEEISPLLLQELSGILLSVKAYSKYFDVNDPRMKVKPDIYPFQVHNLLQDCGFFVQT